MTDINDPRDRVIISERPWGTFEQFALNEPVTVKIITVKPGHRLSLQTHQHRGEFWRVLDVPLDVTVNERTWSAQAGENIWIPQGGKHRLGNSGPTPGRIMEIAWGTFDENDIVRLDDDYSRPETDA